MSNTYPLASTGKQLNQQLLQRIHDSNPTPIATKIREGVFWADPETLTEQPGHLIERLCIRGIYCAKEGPSGDTLTFNPTSDAQLSINQLAGFTDLA